MQEIDKEKISKLIGMFGSDFDNERAIAAKKIYEIAKNKKITVVELLKQCFQITSYSNTREQEQRKNPYNTYREPPKKEKEEVLGVKEIKLLIELEKKFGIEMLNDWEQDFLISVVSDYRSYGEKYFGVTSKQMMVIQKILYKYGEFQKQNKRYG